MMRLIQRLVWPHRSEKFTQTELACSAEVFWVGLNLVRVRNIVVVAIFDLMTYSGRLGRVEIVTLCEGERRKDQERTRPISSSLREVSTWRFREQIACSKKTPALQAKTEL